MRKLKLDPDELTVESFRPAKSEEEKKDRGTVRGHAPSDAADSCWYGCPAQSISGLNPCFC